jgi:hypothetical protein
MGEFEAASPIERWTEYSIDIQQRAEFWTQQSPSSHNHSQRTDRETPSKRNGEMGYKALKSPIWHLRL